MDLLQRLARRLHALELAGSMTWEIPWALILGFTLSAVVQAVVRRESVTRLLGDDRPQDAGHRRRARRGRRRRAPTPPWRWPARCSARAPTSPPPWPSRSPRTNLVDRARHHPGPADGLAVHRRRVRRRPDHDRRAGRAVPASSSSRGCSTPPAQQADTGLAGSMEGHAAMDMSVAEGGSLWQRLTLRATGFTSVSHIFVMEWAAVLRDIVHRPADRRRRRRLGARQLLAALLPDRPPAAGQDLGPADRTGRRRPQLRLLDRQRAAGGGAVERRHQLRRRGQLHLRRPADPARSWSSTGSTTAPGWRCSSLATFYVAIVVAGYVVELLFGAAGLDPARTATPRSRRPTSRWNYTTVPQHRLPAARRGPRRAVRPHRRPGHARR